MTKKYRVMFMVNFVFLILGMVIGASFGEGKYPANWWETAGIILSDWPIFTLLTLPPLFLTTLLVLGRRRLKRNRRLASKIYFTYSLT